MCAKLWATAWNLTKTPTAVFKKRWKAGIAAEVLGLPKNSIGKALYNAKIYLEMPDLFCWTAVIILLSLLFEKLAAWILRALTSRLAAEKEAQR